MVKKIEIPPSDFCITIDYQKGSPNPSRVFETMSRLIKAFEEFDRDLVLHLDNRIETILLLEDIETGSIKTWLADGLKGLPDDALKDGDWKKAVGHYLHRGKYFLLNFLENKVEITNAEEIEVIEMELQKTAKESGVDQLPTYVPTTKKSIIKNINNITNSLKPLIEGDKAFYESGEDKSEFNLQFRVNIENIDDLLSDDSIESYSRMMLKVKKADFLGESMWEFRHGESILRAKIMDNEWLTRFQHREVSIQPQDALLCRVKTTVKYNQNNEVVSTIYEVENVLEVKRNIEGDQGSLFKGEN